VGSEEGKVLIVDKGKEEGNCVWNMVGFSDIGARDGAKGRANTSPQHLA
jgi:hypothetical protein